MDAKKTAQQVLEQVGGAENVTFLTHCVTRLRFNLKSMDGVDEAKVKAVPGVMGVVNKGGQYQVIIGNEVAAVYDELMKLGDFGGKEVKQPAAPAEEKKSRVSIILDTLAGVFTPLMPLIAGAGMIKALLSVLTLFGWIDKSGNLYYFLNFIADSSYYFLPIFLANSAAKKVRLQPADGHAAGGHPAAPELHRPESRCRCGPCAGSAGEDGNLFFLSHSHLPYHAGTAIRGTICQ